MQILPINQNNKTNFQAVNQKYYQWAKKDIEYGIGLSAELFTQLEMDIFWKELHPQDGIDTINAIKKMLPEPWEGIDITLDYIKKHLDLIKK